MEILLVGLFLVATATAAPLADTNRLAKRSATDELPLDAKFVPLPPAGHGDFVNPPFQIVGELYDSNGNPLLIVDPNVADSNEDFSDLSGEFEEGDYFSGEFDPEEIAIFCANYPQTPECQEYFASQPPRVIATINVVAPGNPSQSLTNSFSTSPVGPAQSFGDLTPVSGGPIPQIPTNINPLNSVNPIPLTPVDPLSLNPVNPLPLSPLDILTLSTLNPLNSVDPLSLTPKDHLSPLNPLDPVDPLPLAPIDPLSPVNPLDPVDPLPLAPIDPLSPLNPLDPVDPLPLAPIDALSPLNPLDPVDPLLTTVEPRVSLDPLLNILDPLNSVKPLPLSPLDPLPLDTRNRVPLNPVNVNPGGAAAALDGGFVFPS